MLIKNQLTLPFILTLCFLKCIICIGTQSGWYFPPFDDDDDDDDKVQRKLQGHHHYQQHQYLLPYEHEPTLISSSPPTIGNVFDQQPIYQSSYESQQTSANSINSDMARLKSYADYQSNQLLHATSRAYQIEQRLASAVDLTRRKRMHFFYGLMLHSYNYIRDLRIKGQKMTKDIRKQVNSLTRMSRKARSKKYKLTAQMDSLEKLVISSSGLEDKLNRSSNEFNDILDDFMVEVYKRKASNPSPSNGSESYIEQETENVS